MPGREESFYKTSPLRSRLQEVADAALSEGVTMPMHTTFEVVRAGDREGEGEEGGMDFIVSVMATKALEAKVRDKQGKSSLKHTYSQRCILTSMHYCT